MVSLGTCCLGRAASSGGRGADTPDGISPCQLPSTRRQSPSKALCSDCQEHKHRDDFAKRQRDRSAKKCLCCAAKIEVEAQEGKTIRLATARIKTFGTAFVPPPPRDLQPSSRDAQQQTAADCHDLIIKELEGRQHTDWYFHTKAVVYPAIHGQMTQTCHMVTPGGLDSIREQSGNRLVPQLGIGCVLRRTTPKTNFLQQRG